MAEERRIPTSGPRDNPTFTILADGEQISGLYSIISVWVMKEANKIACAEIVLHDGDPAKETFELSEKPELQPGKEIEIQAGYASDEASIFKGIIIKQSIRAKETGASTLKLELRDVAVKMTIGRKSKYFFEATDSSIMEEVIDAYGIDKEVESTSATHAEMVQYYSTDWDFMVSRAEKNGMLVMAYDGMIHIKKPDLSAEPAVKTIFGNSMYEFESEMDARYQFSAVKSSAWNYTDQEVSEAEAAEPDVDKQGELKSTTLADVIGLESFELRHSGQVLDEELQAWADAQMLKSRLAKIRGRVKIQGFPNINPGDVITLEGVGKNFNGNAFVSAVGHTVTNGIWMTDVQFGLRENWFSAAEGIMDTPASGLVPGVAGLQVGVVVQLEEDPEGEDRVLVKIPLVSNNDDGIWARVSTLDAGENRGSFFRPEIGDEVILGFLNDDPRDPVILGMLNSSAKPAPVVAADDNNEKGFVTRSGIKLLFDDDKISLTLETPNGNTLVLSDDEGGIKLEDENGNTIEMTSDGIVLKSAKDLSLEAKGDVKIKGVNVSVAASSKFKAEGKGGADLIANAITTIKGSLVKVN